MNKDFPRIITLLRKEKNLTQKQVADDLEVSQALLSHYEKGIRECNLDFVVKIANYYDVSTDYLLGRTPQRYSEISDVNEEISDERRMALSQIINKRLITNTISIIYECLIKLKSRKLSNLVSNYFFVACYRTFRTIYSSNPNNEQNLFTLDKNIYKDYSNVSLLTSEAKIDSATNVNCEFDYINSCKDVNISVDSISEEFPQLASSLFNVIQRAENSLKYDIK